MWTNTSRGGTGLTGVYGRNPGDATAGGAFSFAREGFAHVITDTILCENLAQACIGDSSGDATAGGIYGYTSLSVLHRSVMGNVARGGDPPANGGGGSAARADML